MVGLLCCVTCLHADDRFYFLTELDGRPALVHEPDLYYPEGLKAEGVVGSVRMAILINEEGNTEITRIIESSNKLFEASARIYAGALVYEPPLRNGEPVKARTVLTVDFQLDGPANDAKPSADSLRGELDGLSKEELTQRLKSFMDTMKNQTGGSTSSNSSQNSFSLNELDAVPKRLSGNPPEYPMDLRRQRVEGLVKLLVLIQTDGSVWVERVVEAAELAFIMPAIRCAESCVFEVPKKNGRPVNARFMFPIRFRISDTPQ